MITRIRLIVLLARPAVIVLLALFTEVGLAQAGRAEGLAAMVPALAVVLAFLLFSVACNDLADEIRGSGRHRRDAGLAEPAAPVADLVQQFRRGDHAEVRAGHA
jgi:hypothetical protein